MTCLLVDQATIHCCALKMLPVLAAAQRFFERAIDRHDVPGSITIDEHGADAASVSGLVADSGAAIELRQSKYLNNVVEQDRLALKR